MGFNLFPYVMPLRLNYKSQMTGDRDMPNSCKMCFLIFGFPFLLVEGLEMVAFVILKSINKA